MFGRFIHLFPTSSSSSEQETFLLFRVVTINVFIVSPTMPWGQSDSHGHDAITWETMLHDIIQRSFT
jgi:hypothetical protein